MLAYEHLMEMDTAMIRILLVDDQRLIRCALTMLLDVDSSFHVVGEAENGEDAVRQAEAMQPDVVLMDIHMPIMDGIEATRAICDRVPDAKVLVLTVDDDDRDLAKALKAGAAGYLLKNTPPDELAIAIQAVRKGYMHLGPGLGQKVIAKIIMPAAKPELDWSELTPREHEILKLIAQGSSNRAIAELLFITEKTVKNHITSILNRLNLQSRTQAAIYYLENANGTHF